MKRLILSLICFLVTPIQLMFAVHYPVDIFAHLQEQKDASIIWIDQEKAYLNAERVFVTEQGISLTTDLFGPLLLSNLHQNEEGLYTEIMSGGLSYACLGEVNSLSIPVNHKGPCWVHNLWCKRCGGCSVILCPMNCSCFD